MKNCQEFSFPLLVMSITGSGWHRYQWPRKRKQSFSSMIFILYGELLSSGHCWNLFLELISREIARKVMTFLPTTPVHELGLGQPGFHEVPGFSGSVSISWSILGSRLPYGIGSDWHQASILKLVIRTLIFKTPAAKLVAINSQVWCWEGSVPSRSGAGSASLEGEQVPLCTSLWMIPHAHMQIQWEPPVGRVAPLQKLAPFWVGVCPSCWVGYLVIDTGSCTSEMGWFGEWLQGNPSQFAFLRINVGLSQVGVARCPFTSFISKTQTKDKVVSDEVNICTDVHVAFLGNPRICPSLELSDTGQHYRKTEIFQAWEQNMPWSSGWPGKVLIFAFINVQET